MSGKRVPQDRWGSPWRACAGATALKAPRAATGQPPTLQGDAVRAQVAHAQAQAASTQTLQKPQATKGNRCDQRHLTRETRCTPRWRSTTARALFLSSSYLQGKEGRPCVGCPTANCPVTRAVVARNVLPASLGGVTIHASRAVPPTAACNRISTAPAQWRSSAILDLMKAVRPNTHSQHVVKVCRDVRDRQVGVAAQRDIGRHAIVLDEGLRGRTAEFQREASETCSLPHQVRCRHSMNTCRQAQGSKRLRKAAVLHRYMWPKQGPQPAAARGSSPACSAWRQSPPHPPG